jgi:DNA-binding ferritin-like protein
MNLDSKVNFFIGLQNQLRIYHWQTKGLARHKALGKVYDELGNFIDDFVEISMGKYGRFNLSDETKTITFLNLSETNPLDVIKKSIDVLIGLSQELDNIKDTDLLNLRDEMVGLLNKLLYLLTLE